MFLCPSELSSSLPKDLHINLEKGGEEGVTVKIPKDRLTMCLWIGSHFHGSIDFYGVAFSAIFNRVTRMELHIFEILGVRKSWQVRIYKQEINGKKVVTVF